jgi:hypothetical protein
MRDAQEGQLDPSRVSMAADPDGGKLIEGPMLRGYDTMVCSGNEERSDPEI